MRFIFLSDGITVFLCFAVWFILKISAVIICYYLPDRFYSSDSIAFQTYTFENDGKIYDKLFHVRKWKHLLPDGGLLLNKNGFSKKHLIDFSIETLEKYLVESVRGELTHWLTVLPFWLFGFFTPPIVIPIMFIYSLILNIPCIIVQRYNRPRIKHLLDIKKEKMQLRK